MLPSQPNPIMRPTTFFSHSGGMAASPAPVPSASRLMSLTNAAHNIHQPSPTPSLAHGAPQASEPPEGIEAELARVKADNFRLSLRLKSAADDGARSPPPYSRLPPPSPSPPSPALLLPTSPLSPSSPVPLNSLPRLCARALCTTPVAQRQGSPTPPPPPSPVLPAKTRRSLKSHHPLQEQDRPRGRDQAAAEARGRLHRGRQGLAGGQGRGASVVECRQESDVPEGDSRGWRLLPKP